MGKLTAQDVDLLEEVGFVRSDYVSEGDSYCAGCDGIPTGVTGWSWRTSVEDDEWEAYCPACAVATAKRWIDPPDVTEAEIAALSHQEPTCGEGFIEPGLGDSSPLSSQPSVCSSAADAASKGGA